MPRGRDECWLEVKRNLDEDSGKRHPRVTCKHCMTEWTSNEKARVIEHLQRCAELPELLWRTYQPHRLDPTLPSAAELQQQQRARTRGIGSMSANEQDIATSACAQWIHSSGLNPNITEHPAFRAFLRTLRPAFKVPSRHQLTHALVDAPLMFIAYLADPQERHRRPAILDSNEETQSRSLQAFLLKYANNHAPKASSLLAMLSLLRVKQGPFANNMVWMASEQMTPIQWWQNFWTEEHPDLAELCMIALAIAPPGDTIERNWSPHSFVHILKRNNLSPDLVNRLVVTFWNLRIQHGWVDDSVNVTTADAPHEPDAEFTPDHMEGFMPSANAINAYLGHGDIPIAANQRQLKLADGVSNSSVARMLEQFYVHDPIDKSCLG
ncbi:uncharacterized protein MYCFIDRAFT_198682 [Pseudocercospora fijiensis CIRAD86]|uniref:HAT C-terminal dimerisation domain-containing protein n=1 Tax=Pseudocercospora fijiensis (strain CIRAD86) TaxID=383855 RepID=M3ATH6_PSEFD|nr:uncharacterized protein MYCFIDRAFT_198682 [Pseudocercospora fijiensis CIRAD86]EME80458.1 hypothetical protein MYCFIDRAFT_198682 [Pseudocercospora fijiensis CIRAD86]